MENRYVMVPQGNGGPVALYDIEDKQLSGANKTIAIATLHYAKMIVAALNTKEGSGGGGEAEQTQPDRFLPLSTRHYVDGARRTANYW